jgi:glucose 1-dehydrogenase
MQAIVTGAASGIGRACARKLVSSAQARGEQAAILLVDREGGGIASLGAELAGLGATVSTLVADLADPAAGEMIAQQAQTELGGLDVVVSNAGVFGNSLLEDLDVASWELNFAVNTRATWLLAKACCPLLKDRGGAIIATASISATHPTPPHGAYSASKAALVMLVQQLAYEWGPYGIRCNCVSPGMIHTAMTDSVYSDPAKRAERASQIPLRRVGTPEDIARAVSFLAGPESEYITGVNLAVDGGVQTALMPTMRKASIPN